MGSTPKILDIYAHGENASTAVTIPKPTPDLLQCAYVTRVKVEDLQGGSPSVFQVGQPYRIRVGFKVASPQSSFVAALGLMAPDGTPVQTTWTPPQALSPGDYEAVFVQDRVVLQANSYSMVIGLSERDRTMQQIETGRIDITGEAPVGGYYGGTSGVGQILNSMGAELRLLP